MIAPEIRAFMRVYELGGISQAARALSLSKSVVSARLGELEHAVGAKLFKRTTRKLNPTPIADSFYRNCATIEAQAEAAWTEVKNHGGEIGGPIAITAPNALLERKVAPMIGALMKTYPDLKPTLIIDDLRRDLREENIDLAITVGELEDSDLKCIRLWEFHNVLCGSVEYLSAKGVGHCPADVASLDFITAQWRLGIAAHTLKSVGGDELVIRPATTRVANSIPTMLTLTKLGAGVSILPDFLIEHELQEGSIIKLFPDYDLPATPVYAVHPYGNLAPANVRRCIDELRKMQLSRKSGSDRQVDGSAQA